jgi:diaminopimelate decarboxylase
VLVFARTGAYGWDISHHDFLRHDPPEFVLL